MRYLKAIIILFITAAAINAFGQNQHLVDSLKVEFENAEDDIEKSDILLQLSRLHWRIDFSLAIQYAEQAIELLEDDLETIHAATAYRELGNALLLSGNYERSLKNLLVSKNIAHEIGNNFEIFANAVSIGGVYDRLEDFEESIKFYFEAMAVYNKCIGTEDEGKMARGATSLYNNIGNYYLTSKEHEKAEEYYKKGLALAKTNHDYYNIASISNNLGKIMAFYGNDEKALSHFRNSEKVRLNLKDKSGLGVTYFIMGEYFMQKQQYDSAIYYALKSDKLGVEVGALLTQRTAAGLLTNSYDSLNNCSMALHYHKIYKRLSDSIINEKSIREITNLRMLNEQAIIDNKRMQEEQKVRLKIIVVISFLIVCLAVMVLLLAIARNRQRRTDLEKSEVENSMLHKKKELATNVLYLLRNKEVLESVNNKLQELKNNVLPENKKAVQRVIVELQNEIDTSSWDEFERRFQDVHQTFYDKLQTQFPELTPSERKLAAFLKLNMSSKEISAITGQSIRSLEVARYRLRKKLNITNTDVNLISFLADL